MGSEGSRFDALIVGGGPVGCVAALHLAQAGLSVGLVEEHHHPYPYPRAVMLDAYSCAILSETLGADFERVILERAAGAGYFLDRSDLDHPFAWTDLDIGDVRNWFVQPQMESVVRDVVAAESNIETFFGWSARKLFVNNAPRLTIEHAQSAEMRELSATYLLGCDGGNSFVRKQAGGSLTQLGNNVSFLVVDAIVEPQHRQGRNGAAYQVVDQERPTTYLPMGPTDHVRWEFRINPGDDILALQSPSRIRELIAPYADPEHTELLRHTVYKFNSLIADRWRFGNVFLCGDAAHQTSPFLGQGLNMGIRNTRNLCQKIALVASGSAHHSLLDQYQAECFDDTKATIKEALRMGKVLFNTTRPANGLRSTVGRVRRGRPIDITAQVAPTARTLEAAKDVPGRVRKILPQIRIESADGPATFLTLLDPARPKIIAHTTVAPNSFDELSSLPSQIRPDLYVVVGEHSTTTEGTPLVMTDAAQRHEFFGDDAYVVLLENSVLLGRFGQGQEREVSDAIRQASQLIA